ncbi:MAG: lipoyl synthase, partial [Gemmatimonadota bacterium]|nr:lipoyl synthase [Gemmatimonadota bacterium]
DLRASDVNILTLGQYLRPTESHLPIVRYYTPDEFAELREIGMRLGFTHVQASPLTRSSYHAWEQAEAASRGREASEGVASSGWVPTAELQPGTADPSLRSG